MVFSNWSVNEGVDQAALFEEEEEDQYEIEDEHERTSFVFSFEGSYSIDSLIDGELVISIGSAANSFIKTYVDLHKYDVIAQFNPVIKENTKTNKLQTCQLLRNGSVILCLLHYRVDAKDAFFWISNLLKALNPSKTSVLCSSPRSNFVNLNNEMDNSDTDFLRCLKSFECTRQTNVKTLETGNTIRNLPAAAMSYCSSYKKPCMIYMAFTESHFVDVFTLKCFAPVIKETGLVKVQPEVLGERLKNFEGYGVADNNVYI